VFAAAVAVGFSLRLGALAPQRLLLREPDALFVAGLFGVLVGTLMFRFWRLHEKSATYFRFARDATLFENEGHFLGGGSARIAVGKNEGDAFDLKPPAQLCLCVGVALLVGLGSIDARAIELLARARKSVAQSSTSFCPELENKPANPADDPNAPGCELVRRAYALGYAKDLGQCGVNQTRAAAAAVCTLRQRDEPFVHYAWRLLERFGAGASKVLDPSAFASSKTDFEARITRLDSIRSAQREVLSSAPHSSHHIWVNLPDPGGSGLTRASCEDRYRFLSHRPAPTDPSKAASQVFEHVLAQLLFESRYEPAAAYCREVQIHWGAGDDACKRLTEDPEKFLAESGVLPHVHAVLDRWRLGNELAALGKQRSNRQLPPQAFVSFSCYVEKPQGSLKRASWPATIEGLDFTAEELTVRALDPNATLYVDRYEAVASLLIRGFHYGALLSEAGLDLAGGEGLEPSFSKSDFEMSRLFGLEAVDLYLSPSWLAHRPDLLEVYPYQLHLKNYVKVFRGQYRRERGRL
jgi:hypothetical protein